MTTDITPFEAKLIAEDLIDRFNASFGTPVEIIEYLAAPDSAARHKLIVARGMEGPSPRIAKLMEKQGMEPAVLELIETSIYSQLSAHDLLVAIWTAKNLVSLRKILRITDRWTERQGLPVDIYDFDDLPNFCNEAPEDTGDVYSWDHTHQLVLGLGWEIEPRPDPVERKKPFFFGLDTLNWKDL